MRGYLIEGGQVLCEDCLDPASFQSHLEAVPLGDAVYEECESCRAKIAPKSAGGET